MMRVSRSFPIDLPIEQIDMYRWVTAMTSADYESFTPAHKALGSFRCDSRFFMVNNLVENSMRTTGRTPRRSRFGAGCSRPDWTSLATTLRPILCVLTAACALTSAPLHAADDPSHHD